MAMLAELVDGVIGVDTHRDTLTAAAVTNLGGVLPEPRPVPMPPATSSCSALRPVRFLAVACGRSRERAASAPA
jgi:hypothetical protein